MDESDIGSLIETPPSDDLGDLAFPCFSLAKSLKKAPAAIAGELKGRIEPDEFLERIETKGPYINFFIDKKRLIASVIAEIAGAEENYGGSNEGSGKTIVIEYSSPNIAKPFGIGHLRSTVIGAALKRIYSHLGYSVQGINHLGDWGTQFGKLIYAFKQWGDEARLKENPIEHLYEIYVKIHQWEEEDPGIADATREEFKKLENGDEENTALWERFSDLSRVEFEKIYKMLGVEFDSSPGESFYVDKMPAVEKSLMDLSLLVKSKDATVVDLEKYGMPPALIRKSDDTSLYATRDLAAAIYRKNEFDFHKMIYVVGVAQTLYFNQLFKVLELMGNKWVADCHHASFGWIKLGDEMMSTRKGNIVFLDDVIAKTIEKTKAIIEENSPGLPEPEKVAFEVGVGAVIFADLAYRRDTDISFDWAKMLDFRGYSGPYVQYTHARISSVLRKYGKGVPANCDSDLLKLPEEFAMAKILSRYSDIIDKAAREFEPFHISSYLLELCGVFNTYYQKYKSAEDRILSTDPGATDARISLINAAGIVLRSGLRLLGISAPEMM